jgi:hypothetical protein
VVDVAGRIQNSKAGLGQPEALAVIVTGVPEPLANGGGGEKESVADVHAKVRLYGVEP